MENVNGTSVQRGSASDYHHLFQFLHSFLNGIHLVLIVEHKSNLSQFFGKSHRVIQWWNYGVFRKMAEGHEFKWRIFSLVLLF